MILILLSLIQAANAQDLTKPSCTCDLLASVTFNVSHDKENDAFNSADTKSEFGEIELTQLKDGSYECGGSMNGVAAFENTDCYSTKFAELTTGIKYRTLKSGLTSCIDYVKSLTSKVQFRGAYKDRSYFGTKLTCPQSSKNKMELPKPVHGIPGTTAPTESAKP